MQGLVGGYCLCKTRVIASDAFRPCDQCLVLPSQNWSLGGGRKLHRFAAIHDDGLTGNEIHAGDQTYGRFRDVVGSEHFA